MKSLLVRRLLKSVAVHLSLNSSSNHIKTPEALKEEEEARESNLQTMRRTTKRATTRKMLRSLQRKRVGKISIRTGATFAARLAVCCAATAALKSRTSHALASRSHLKVTGTA